MPDITANEYIKGLVARARAAQKIAEGYTQEKVDELCAAITWAVVKEENARKIAKLAFEESQMGYEEAKYIKLQIKPRGVLRDMQGHKSVGVIEEIPEHGLVKYAKPVGVVGGIVPCTNPEVTPPAKAASAIKGRNAIILAPHPRTKGTNTLVCDLMRAALKKHGAPEDLILYIDPENLKTHGLEATSELMKQVDLVIATGGGALVHAAYSSGTPAYGVGAGNVVSIIDETADLADACEKVMRSKTFDFATSCSADNNVMIKDTIYDAAMAGLKENGGYLCTPEEKAKLQATMFLPDGHLDPKSGLAAASPQKIAETAGFSLPEGAKFIMVESTGAGAEHPFSGEKLSVVLNVYKYTDFDKAIDFLNEIHEWSGKGHSCAIHSTDESRIRKLAERTYTSRIMVRLPTSAANSGNWFNGMPFSMSLGCGSWGGNSTTENITWRHLINVTWVSSPIPLTTPKDEDLFGDIIKD
ncbi:MAG: aldehyde dehydrogenase family protein [Oscillospiraceae bacterium]|nr:aldehyde dehydrogenase family protein [Oscillospiraceae bacterium]